MPSLRVGRRARAVALVLVLAAGAAWTGPPSHAAVAGVAAVERLAGAQGVLDTRAAAVRSGDRDAFLATVDPSAPRDFREAQARQFDGLRSLPLVAFSLRAVTGDSGDLGAAAAGRYGTAPVFVPETRQSYRLEGYDERDHLDELWLTFVERDGRWYVGGDGDLEALGLESDRQLWDFGPVQLQRREHVIVVSHPEQAERAAALAAMAEEAIAAFSTVWDQPWSGRVPLILPGSVEELERLLESTVDLDKFVAFASYAVVRDDGFTTTAPRILVQDARLSRYDRTRQVETLVHELVHVATAPISGPFVPNWVHEGVADWAATGRRTGERRPPGGGDRLPRDFELSTGPSTAIVRSYDGSRAAVSLLAARRGPGAPTAFLRELGEARIEPGSTDHHVDVALRRSAGMSLGDLEQAWAARRTG